MANLNRIKLVLVEKNKTAVGRAILANNCVGC